jgi:thermostable 8-oxoguanine DNA glycosylase
MCPIDKQQWAITEQQLRSLVTVAKDLRNKYQDDLDSKKKMGLALQERSDFLWYELLVSYSTWGGSRGSEGLIEDEKRYQQVSYEELKKIDAKEDRINRLRQIMKDAKVRWFNKKAPMLAQCFEKIEAMGGLTVANTTLLNKKSAAEMMKFLKSFPGIGSKYASNIMMDCYHPLFRDRIALDSRVRSVSKELGLDFKNYSDHENFYLSVAKEAGIEGWELDRLIYGHTDDFLRFLRMVD